MALKPEQFERHLAGDSLAPVYLIAGAEDLLRLEAADALRRRARELGFAEREVFEVERSFDWDTVAASFAAMSLFASRRLIELRLPTGRPDKAGAALIEKYCAAPPPDLCLLILAADWSRKHEGGWTRAVARAGQVLETWPLRAEELPGWITRRLRAHGLQADPDAAVVLAARIEGNLLAAAQEVDKLALLLPADDRTPITVELMQALIADSARFTVFGMAEAALAGEPARALRMLAGLRAEGEQVAGLLPWLGRQLALLAQLSERRGGGDAALRQVGLWGNGLAAMKRALGRVDAQRAARFAAECGRVEQIAKGRADGDAWIALERLLVAVAAPRTASSLLPA